MEEGKSKVEKEPGNGGHPFQPCEARRVERAHHEPWTMREPSGSWRVHCTWQTGAEGGGAGWSRVSLLHHS